MKQIISRLRYYWATLTDSLFYDGSSTTIRFKNQSDSAGIDVKVTARPVDKVYYSTPGMGTFWAYIDKGRIIKTTTRRNCVQ